MPSGNMETFLEDWLFSVQINTPWAFYLNLFGIIDTHISILHIFHNYHDSPNQVVQMAYLERCLVNTWAKNKKSHKVNFKWEQNLKRVNGMIPKDVKPSSLYSQIFYTIARKKNKSI